MFSWLLSNSSYQTILIAGEEELMAIAINLSFNKREACWGGIPAFTEKTFFEYKKAVGVLNHNNPLSAKEQCFPVCETMK